MVVLPVKKAKGLAAAGVLYNYWISEPCFFFCAAFFKARPKANFRASGTATSSRGEPTEPEVKVVTPVNLKPREHHVIHVQ